MEIGKIEQLTHEPNLLGLSVVEAIKLISIPVDTGSIVNMLVETDADWTEVLRFLGKLAEKQRIFLDTQAISEQVAARLR